MMATSSTPAPAGSTLGSRRRLLWIGAGLFMLMILLLGWLAAAKLEERRRELFNLMEKQKLQASQMAQDGRIIADLVFGELRQAFRAVDLPAGTGIGNLQQEPDHYEYLYGRPGATQNIDRLMSGNLVGLVPAKTDPQLARLQKVLQHLFERDLNILVHKWSSRVAYTYWMSKDQSHAFSVPRWDFDAAIANSPLKSAKSAMAALASAMLVPFASQIKPAEMQIFRTDAWIDTTDGRVLQTMVSPMFDAKGEWVGNAAVDFALEEIDQMLAQSGLQQAQWLLVAPGNTVLARHVDKQGPLGPLLWGKALSGSAVTLPPAKDGAESTAGGYRVNVALVPGSNLHLYLLTPSGWIYQDLAALLVIAFAGVLAIGFALLPVARYQRQRDDAARTRIRSAEIQVQQEMARHERALQLNAWAGRLASVLQKQGEDSTGFASAVLSELVPALGGVVGAFFMRKPNGESYSCVAGYNIAAEHCQPFAMGEGIAGAAALAQQVSTCLDIPPGYLGVRSGTLDMDPIAITAIPLRIGELVLALIEVGFLELPREQDLVLAEALPVIAFSLELFQRKQVTLSELRERSIIEARQRLILGSMQDGLFGQDVDGRVSFINDAALRMLGYAEDELIGQAMHALVHHHHADGRTFEPENCAMFLTSQDGLARTVSDEVFWRKDGSSFPIEYTTTALRESEAITGAVVSFRDISARKAAENAVVQERARLQNILDNSPICIAFSTRRHIHFANPKFTETFGIRSGDIAPQLYVSRSDRDALMAVLRRDGAAHNREIQMLDRDQRPRDMLVSYLAMTYDGQDGILGWLMDITGRKQSEAELRERMQELERFSRLTVDREEKMVELKQEINALLVQQGQAEKYRIVV